MNKLGQIVFWTSYRLSFLVAKWRLAWSYWNENGEHAKHPIHWN